MNANEVIATLAGEGAHPNDHVNMGQSSNDVFPSRRPPRRARRGRRTSCCPRSSGSRASLAAKADEFKDIVKAGRTHLMDAVPVTLGQEFAGYAAQIRLGRAARGRTRCRRSRRSRSAAPRPAPGSTPTRDFAAKVRERMAADTGLTISRARGPVRGAGQPRRARRAVRRAEGRRGLADQDRRRPRADGLRPARGHRRALPARAAEGLLDHAGQGQPGDPGGRAAGRPRRSSATTRRSRSAASRASSSSTCASR